MLYSLHLLPTTEQHEVAEDVHIILVITCRFQVKAELGYSFINAKSVPNELCMNANSHGHCCELPENKSFFFSASKLGRTSEN